MVLALALLSTPSWAVPDSWVSRTPPPAVTGVGGKLVAVRSGDVYALRGAGTTALFRYARSTNSWTTLQSTPVAVTTGSAFVYPGNRGEYLFAASGGTTDFLRYTIALDTWLARAATPGVLGDGAAAVWAGDDTIFVHQGGGNTPFYRYNIRPNAWTTVTNDGFGRGAGAGLAWPGGDTIYSAVGNGTQRFHAYHVPTGSWVTSGLESTPVVPGAGAALVATGSDTLYLLAGGNDTRLFRYRIRQDAWDTMTGAPAAIIAGGSMTATWEGDTYLFAIEGGGAPTFYRYELSDSQVPALGSNASSMTVTAGVRITDSVSAVVTDADENRTGLPADEAVFVLVSNLRTGESEVLRLFERTVMGSFGGNDTVALTTDAGLQSSGDERLHVLAGDTIRISYADPDNAADTAAGLVYPFHDTAASSFFFVPAYAGVGDSLALVVVLDTDQNFRGTIQETVLVRATNNRTGESEAWVLTENAANAGYFGRAVDSLTLTVNAAFAATGNGRMVALAGDTITVRYVDPSGGADTIASGLITCLHDSGASTLLAAPALLLLDDSAYAVVVDSDQNFNAFAIETVTVILVNNRTGETETRTLTEPNANAGYFGSLAETIPVTSNNAFAASGDGKLFALAGDTLVMRYIDPTGGFDSATSATFFTRHDSTLAACTFATQAKIGDSVTAIVIDTDQNLFGGKRDTISVMAINGRTGEQETFTLVEKSVNAGYFGGSITDTLLIVIDTTYSGSGNGRMFALAGDTIILVYTDPTDPGDTEASGSIPVFHDSGACTFAHLPGFAGVGDSLSSVLVRDSDQNLNGLLVETVLVRVVNNRTSESEAWTLNENGANAGYFGTPLDTITLTVDAAFAATGNGRLVALAGDSLVVSYSDPTGGPDTAASILITARHDSVASVLLAYPSQLRLNDSATALVRDTDQNLDAFRVETVTIILANGRTGETETRSLTENGANGGYFGSVSETIPVTSDGTFAASGDGRLFALAGDTLFLRYNDPTGGSDSSISAYFVTHHDSVAASCTFVTEARIGDSVTAIVIDTDQNFFGGRIETVSLRAINNRTGEQETFTLFEKSANAGYFGGAPSDSLLIVLDSTYFGSGNGRMYAVAGDTLTLIYTDPTDPADTVASGPITVLHDSAAAALTSPGNRPITDSLTAIVRDSDQNFSALLAETVSVEVRNNRTGETERLDLTEAALNAGYFGGRDTLILSTDSGDGVSDNDSLYVVTGDTIRILYTDPTLPSDTVAVTLTILPSPTASFLVDSPAKVALGESVTAFLRDTDQNFSGITVETVAISLHNMRTGEQETWTLTESGVNGGYFGRGTESLPVTMDITWSASGNGRLFALAGDTLRVQYSDPDDASDTRVSALFAAYHDTVPSAFAVVPSWAVTGDSLFGLVLRDTDQDFFGTRRETVTVIVTHQRTGETETWTLTEDSASSGYFGSSIDSLPVRQDASQSASSNGTLFALAGDTLRVTYIDPTGPSDSITSGLIVVRLDTTPSAFTTVPPSAKIGDSITVIVRDTDQDFSGLLVETVSVLVTNQRTGETETIVLSEAGANGGYFGGGNAFGDTLPVTIDATYAPSGDGRIRALAGDTLTVRYTDANDAADTLLTSLFAAYHDSAASVMTHPASVRLGDSLTAIVRDSDQNFTGLGVETVAVIVTNNRTGETERLVLTEVGVNGGYFGGTDSVPVDTLAASGASGSGRFFALAGDTFTILYTDPTLPADTAASAPVAAYHETGAAAITWVPATIALSDSVAFALRDTDQNFFGTRVETVSVVVRNNRSAETELLTLTEVGANGGYFGGPDTLPLSSLLADNGNLSGKIYVLVGDTLNVSYADPSGGVDTLAATIIVVPDPVASAVHANTPSAKIFDSITVTIRDTDQNYSGTILETVPVVFTNTRTGETETVVLNENGANGGYFGLGTDTLPVTMDISWNPSGNGRLFVLAGDTVTALYVDPNDASDTVRTNPVQAYHDSVGAFTVFMPVIAAIYDSVSTIVRDTDQNFWGLRVETVSVVVTNNRTGETEVLVLTETIANAGYFGGNDTLAIVIDTTYGGSGNGRMYASAGDTLTIRYTDPSDPNDTLVSPTFIGVYHDSAPAVGIYQPSVRLYDSVTAIIHDSDQNHWGLYAETVLVSVRNTRTNEVETRVLNEAGVNAGYFGGLETRAVTMDITFSATGNGILFMLAGDTLLVTYQDPTMASDSITSPPIQAYHDSVFATLLVTSPSAKLYDSITMRILDTDQNFFGTRTETVPFSVLNYRTGEIETFALTESGANAGYWGLPNDTAWVTMDATYAPTGDGRLYALAGDSIIMRYHDPSGPPDSVAAAGITAFHDTISSAWTFYPPAVEIYDSFRVIVRDSDQNFQGLQAETVLVTFTVTRTGETETLVLREPNANAGYFGLNDTLPVTIDVTWIASGNGRLHVLAGDTVRVVYRDPTDTTDTIYTPFLGIYHDTIAATWVVPTVTRYDDSVIAYIRDTDQNFYGTEIETVWVTVINNRTGEIETLVLRESGANGGYFGQPGDTLPVTRLVIDAPSGSGRLYALGGDSLTIRYVDPSDPSDSLTGTVDLVSWFIAAEPLGAGLGVYNGALEWGDYDRDGDPDLAVSGLDQTAAARLLIVRNDGFGVFSIASQPMGVGQGLRTSALDWGDYDRDGDLDLAAAGNDNANRRLIIFRNDGAGTFTSATEPMGVNQGVDAGAVQWGDYDQDGDLDLLVTGIDNAARRRLVLYRNDTGTFVSDIEPFGANTGVGGSGIGATGARFGDYDNDGDLDLAVAGRDNIGFTPRLVILQNIRNETYVAAAQPLGAGQGLVDAAMDWGDYDADGDLDLLAAGNENLGVTPRLLVYRNDGGGAFTLAAEPVGANAGYAYPSVRWVDLDNDGDLDFAATGRDAGGVRRFRAFRNNGGGSFAPHTEILGAGLGVDYGAVAWTDWERDGDIDIAMSGQDSTAPRLIIFIDVVGYLVNVAPAAPAPVTANGIVFGSDTVTLTWTAPAGDTTPSAALTYNLRVGRSPQGVEVMSADTSAGDTIAGQVLGNVQNGETAVLYIPHAGSYTWAVQAMDGGQARSAWSAERTFVINASPCTGIYPLQARENESMSARIIDTDQNFSAVVQETVSVIVTNIRTSESEVIVLLENGTNSSSFGGNDTVPLSVDVSWSASANGRLHALAGDTLVVYYLDPDNARDSVTSPQVLVRADTTISVGVYAPNFRVDDSVTANIRDSDENHFGTLIETITVTVRNNRTGETEGLVLTERGINAGYFGGLDTLPLTGDAAQATSGNGRLFVLAGDTVAILYRDATDAADTLQSPNIVLMPDTRPSAGVFPPRLRVGDSVTAFIRDTDQNWSGLRAETITVVVTHQRTGETERVTLTERGANGGYFGGGAAFADTLALVIDSTGTPSGDGRLVMLAGDSLSITYVDPDDPTDSVTSGLITAYPDSTTAAAFYPPVLRVNDSFTLVLRDTDRNFDGLRRETVTVVVLNRRTSETEYLVLVENAPNAGYFGGMETLPLSGQLTYNGFGNGRMYVLAGDTLSVSYVDIRDPLDSFVSAPLTVLPETSVSAGFFPAGLRVGDSVSAVIRDSDQDFFSWVPETVAVVVVNNRTGETESLVLGESDPASGYFGGRETLALTIDATWAASGNGRLVALTGDTLTVRYLDPTDASDSVQSSLLLVNPVATASAGVFPPRLRVGDSVTAIVRDTDQNFSGVLRDTLAVIVSHQRTGETERLVLRENVANAGYFGGTETLPLTLDTAHAASGSGRLYAVAGDVLVITYADPDDSTDVLAGPAISVLNDTTAVVATFPASLRFDDSITAVIRDTDRNRSGILAETVLLSIRNVRTGEEETAVLAENGANAGYFGPLALNGESVPLTLDGVWAASGNGRLHALAGDSIRLLYQDPSDPADSASAMTTVVLPDTVASTGTYPASLRTGDSFSVVIRDSDQNLQATLVETVAVTVLNGRTGEQETLVLRENLANSGYFGGADTLPLSGDAGQSASNSGRLFVLAGDTVLVRYRDPNDPLDSTASTGILVLPETTAASAVFPPVLRVGDSLAAVVRDSDQNFRGLVTETVVVYVYNQRNGDSESLVLQERGANSGYFGGQDTLPLTPDASWLAAGNGRLFVLSGDTLQVRYTDPTHASDTAWSSFLVLLPETAAASGVFPPALRTGDSLAAIIRDSDQNFDGLRTETVVVVAQNGRTTEQETFALTENGANGGYFGGADTLPLTFDAAHAASGTGRLLALPGDTIVLRYTDPTDASDSVVSATFTVRPDTTSSSGTFPPGLRNGDSVTAVIRDSDQNRDGLRVETVIVIVTNNRTSETESLVLRENGANGGYFGGAETLPLSVDGADAASGNGRLLVLAGDTVTIRYVDPFLASDSVASGTLASVPPVTASTATFAATLRPFDTLAGTVRDSDENRSGVLGETVSVTFINQRSGEAETLVLRENGVNAGYFGIPADSLPLTPDSTYSASANGRLFVLAGDSVLARYADRDDASDSVQALVAIVPDTTASSGFFPPAIRVGDSVTAIIRDSDENRRGWQTETLAVSVRVGRTNEVETIVLRENGLNAGYFGGIETVACSSSPADSVSGNGRLHVLAGDTITVTYRDPDDASDSLVSPVIAVFVETSAATVTVPAAVAPGETLTITVSDPDQNLSALVLDSVPAVVRNARTGETEAVVLRETAVNAGVFTAGILVTRNPADSLPGSGRLYILIYDTVFVRYLDPTDATDSSEPGITVRPTFTGSVQQVDIRAERAGADTYRLYFIPTGASGETLPGLDGVPLTVTVRDSTGGLGRMTETVVFLSPESAAFLYTRVEAVTLWFEVRVQADSFYPAAQLVAAGETLPVMVTGRRDSTGSEGRLLVPGGFYNPPAFRCLVEPFIDFATESPALAALVRRANASSGARGDRTILVGPVQPEHQFNIRDVAGARYVHLLDTVVSITITYPDANNDGLVDGTGVREVDLGLYYLDEDLVIWVPVPSVTVDVARNFVTGQVSHLTVFTLIGGSLLSTNASGVVIYPNPWRPNDGLADNGREYVAGDLTTGILFENLPGGSKIKVLSLLGELVMDRHVGSGGTYQWDVRNQRGYPVASGQYMVVVEAPNGTRRIEKLTVIR